VTSKGFTIEVKGKYNSSCEAHNKLIGMMFGSLDDQNCVQFKIIAPDKLADQLG